MPRMSDINKKNSKYFKVDDLCSVTGQPWAVAQLEVAIEKAWIGEYKGQDGEPDEVAYFLGLSGIDKPLGVNWTNRTTLEGIVGDVMWDTPSLQGVQIVLSAKAYSTGTGLILSAVQQSSAPAPTMSQATGATQSDTPPTDLNQNATSEGRFSNDDPNSF